MSPEDVRAALAELEDAPATGLALELRLLLLKRWSVFDPRAAWDYARATPENFREIRGSGSIESTLLRAWARTDPKAALQAWTELDAPARQANSFALRQIYSSFAAHDFEQAWASAQQAESEIRAEALIGVASTASQGENRETLLARLTELPAGELRTRALSAALETLSKTGHADEATRWLEAANLDRNERGRIEEQLAVRMFTQDRRATADWLMAGADSPTRRARRMEIVIGLWAHTDPQASGEWLISQGLDADADRAMGLYANTVAANFPADAVAWARRIPDPAARQKTLDRIAETLRQRFPDRADELLRE